MKLLIPDEALPFHLYLDADAEGISAVMCEPKDEKHHPVAFLSRLLRDPETKLAPAEVWLLGAKWAVKKFKWLLVGESSTLYIPDAELIRLIK